MVIPRKVYAIQHNVTKKIYVGSSKNVDNRYKQHINALRRGDHYIEDMQSDFDKYGEDYSVFILDEIVRFADRGKEHKWMVELKTYIRGKGYNYKDKSFQNMESKTPYKEGIPITVD